MIILPHGGQFDELALLAHIRNSGRDYIIQGQQSVALANHTKPDSLDYWLRLNGAEKPDTKQAENQVIDALINTGLFTQENDLICPNSGFKCHGLRATE